MQTRPDVDRSADGPSAKVIPLRPGRTWHDPLGLIQNEAPDRSSRIVLWSVAVLVLVLLVWSAFGKLDIVVGAEGRLVPQTLLKVVQPAEAGVVAALLVEEGDAVKAGQLLVRLDPTIVKAEQVGVARELASQSMQVRRVEAELGGAPLALRAGDDSILFSQVQSQLLAHRGAFLENLGQEKFLLAKAEHEARSARELMDKLDQTLPTYRRAADAYVKLEKEGFLGGLVAADKQREAIEKGKDLDAQRATVAALAATVEAQRGRVAQQRSNYEADLQRELAELRARVAQLQPNLNRSTYRQGLMELRAPQDGVIKDLATTTVGAVVQPGTVIMTLIPRGEQLYADVMIKNEDAGFVRAGQTARIKLATYPFQQYGMLAGTVIHVSPDATDPATASTRSGGTDAAVPANAVYKARVRLETQTLRDPYGNRLALAPGMQVTAEINQGHRTVMAYLLAPVQKAVQEAGRER